MYFMNIFFAPIYLNKGKLEQKTYKPKIHSVRALYPIRFLSASSFTDSLTLGRSLWRAVPTQKKKLTLHRAADQAEGDQPVTKKCFEFRFCSV